MIPVALMGYATSGKDEVADRLVEHLGYEKVSLGEEVNEVLKVLNPIVDFDLLGDQIVSASPVRYREYVEEYGYTRAKEDPEVRRLLQVMGTDVGREMLGNDTWVKMLYERLQSGDAPGYVLTNARFENEVETILDAGGIAVEVRRPGVGPVNEHPSEQVPVAPDVLIHNDGTLEDLHRRVVEEFIPQLQIFSRIHLYAQTAPYAA